MFNTKKIKKMKAKELFLNRTVLIATGTVFLTPILFSLLTKKPIPKLGNLLYLSAGGMLAASAINAATKNKV